MVLIHLLRKERTGNGRGEFNNRSSATRFNSKVGKDQKPVILCFHYYVFDIVHRSVMIRFGCDEEEEEQELEKEKRQEMGTGRDSREKAMVLDS